MGCQCAKHVWRQCLCLWHLDTTKDDNMCERCLWIKEFGLFLRDFEPISVIRDTRKWGRCNLSAPYLFKFCAIFFLSSNECNEGLTCKTSITNQRME
ncbi:hypothetical protein HID58_073931 [Brassica napus]|uniref:Uncharacterized protein n=1 Tax=Brassica napus TaxID=3708 RepID=A0ABQ7YGP6_BRANA|nr:hypothetical protein HID58_073931 [Brassica napus]